MEFAEFYESARDDCLRIVLLNVGDRLLAEELVAGGVHQGVDGVAEGARPAGAAGLGGARGAERERGGPGGGATGGEAALGSAACTTQARGACRSRTFRHAVHALVNPFRDQFLGQQPVTDVEQHDPQAGARGRLVELGELHRRLLHTP